MPQKPNSSIGDERSCPEANEDRPKSGFAVAMVILCPLILLAFAVFVHG